jgi:radical SAM superfamily enzyme YgiQ (UPF0313 family)
MIGANGRFRNPQAVVDEMEALVDLGFRRIRIEDDHFTFRRDRTMAICREILRRGLSVSWRCYSRVDTVDPKLLEWMSRTGCERVMYGAESGSPEILKRIRKRITPEQTRRAVETTKAAGIKVLASFVLGLPGETPETLDETLQFADSLGVPYSLNLLTPYLGTEIRERAETLKIEILSDDWRLYGQGRSVTATPSVGRWHLGRAMTQYQKRAGRYFGDLLEQERNGILGEEGSVELERHRRWRFLRRLIKEDALRSDAKIHSTSGEDALNSLITRLSQSALAPAEDTKRYLYSLARDGHIISERVSSGVFRWIWSPQ